MDEQKIDQNKLYLMIRLARYEQRNRRRTLRINQCYRSDFIGYAILRNFLLTTIAYVLLLAVVALSQLDVILSNFNNMNFIPILLVILVGYLVVIGIYTVITYATASLRYSRVENSITQYEKQLERLDHIYRGQARRRQAEKAQKGETA